jgi:hypothetical protein
MRLALAFLLLATVARGETLVGVVASSGMGEGKMAPYIEQRETLGAFRLSAQGELSRKLESGAGYRFGGDVEWSGPVLVLASYRHRDGGSWTKRGAWLGLGIGDRARLTLRQEIGHNRTTALTSTLRVRRVEAQASAYRYQQGSSHRYGSTLLLSAVLG